MKRLNVFGKLFISLCILCAAVACSDDDDKDLETIVGKWQFDTYEIKLTPSLPVIETLIKATIDEIINIDYTKNIAVINADGTYSIDTPNGENIDKGNYAYKGNTLTLNPDKTGSFALSVISNAGGKLTLELNLEQLAKEYPDLAEGVSKGAIRIMYDAMTSDNTNEK